MSKQESVVAMFICNFRENVTLRGLTESKGK